MKIKILTDIIYTSNQNNEDIIEVILKSLKLPFGLEEESRTTFKNNSEALLNSIHSHENILVYGDVQSGKTNNLIALIDKYMEVNKVNVILYLTGRLNEINLQNYKRFKSILGNRPKFSVLPGMLENHEDVPIIEHNKISEGSTLILSALNRPNKVDEFIKMIESYNYSFLIVNDEADENNFSKKGLDNFKKIKKLFKQYGGKQISITASPYNNLTSDIYDDYLVLETTGAYTGIDKFNIQAIDESEENLFKFLLVEWALSSFGKEQSQFLINLSVWKDDHKIVNQKVKDALLFLTQPFVKEKILEEYPEDIARHINSMLVNVKVNNQIIISNSDNKDNLGRAQNGFYVIIGGNNLSRGVTFENIDLEFIEAKKGINAGTLLQRARWCGYRNNLDNMKIFGNSYAIRGFKELERLNEITKKYDFGTDNYFEMVKDQNFKVIKIKNLGGK